MGRNHERALAWLPTGAAGHMVSILNTVQGNYKVQVSNELTDIVGVLTSCRDNFNSSRAWSELNDTVQYEGRNN
jgi:hypothetical protein